MIYSCAMFQVSDPGPLDPLVEFIQKFKLIYENESRTSSVNHSLLIITLFGLSAISPDRYNDFGKTSYIN